MLDRRKHQRWPTYLGGKIGFAKHYAVVDCLVRNTSKGGARLVVHNGAFVPDEFDLSIPCKQTEARVRTRWRRFDLIGVEISGAEETDRPDAPVPLSYARRVRRLESENESLRRRLRGEE